MKPTDQRAEQALQRAQTAMTERGRLIALGRDLEARRDAAAKAAADAIAARANADTQAVLVPEAEQADWTRRADAEATKIIDAQRDHARLAGACEHLPKPLAEADAEIVAAHEALSNVMSEISAEAKRDLAARIRDAAAHLGKLLEHGHALAAGGVHVGSFITETKVPNPAAGSHREFITGGRMMLGEPEDSIDLTKAWRLDPTAMALFEYHVKFAAAERQCQPHVARINRAKLRDIEKANRARRETTYRPALIDYGPGPSIAPSGTTVHDATIRIDIPVNRTESLTPAEIDALWHQASGGIAPPTSDDAEFLRLALGRPPWMGQQFIEYEAGLALRKANYDKARAATPQATDEALTGIS